MILKNIKIIDILENGKGVGKSNSNKTVFVENAIFGETLNCKVINEKKNYIEAVKIDTINLGTSYRKPPCNYFNYCGGCSIMNINYEEQVKLKKNLIISNLNRISKISLDTIDFEKSSEFNYRNKITLKVKNKKIGYYKRKSHDIVEIDGCILANDNINSKFYEIKNLIIKINNLKNNYINEAIIRTNSNEIILILKTNKIDYELNKKFKNKKYNFNFVIKDKTRYDIIFGNKYLKYITNDGTFIVSLDSFYQVNDYIADKLYRNTSKFIDTSLTDLFCGIGISTIRLGIGSKDKIGVEIYSNAVEDAKINSKINNSNAHFYRIDSEKIDTKYLENRIISVDPPRKGLSEILVKKIIEKSPERLIYISCNPSTLARDLKKFLEVGYKLKFIKGYDMFPQTMEVECVVLLVKK